MEKVAVIRARISEEEKARFVAKCEKEGRVPSGLLRKLINDWTDNEQEDTKQEADYQGQLLHLAVNIPAELRREFMAICRSEGFSARAVIRQLITQWIDQQKEKKEPK